jgi:hypothetical protein
VFGISFGGSAGYSKHEKRQRIEKRGHELTLDDGEENIRILGYIVTKNAGFLNYQIREYEDLMVHFSREIKESSSDGKESATAKSKSKSKS